MSQLLIRTRPDLLHFLILQYISDLSQMLSLICTSGWKKITIYLNNMQYTDIQLEAIKVFWRKDLTEGCVVEFNDHIIRKVYWKVWKNHWAEREQFYIIGNRLIEHYFDSDWILWHIPNLEDLFRVAEEKWVYMDIENKNNEINIWKWEYENSELLLSVPYNPTIPLLDQPSLPDILNLFK